MWIRIDHTPYRARRIAQAILSGCVLWICGCAENPPAPIEDRSLQRAKKTQPMPSRVTTRSDVAAKEETYRVVKGDSLHSIAFSYGLDYRDLAQWNRIAPPYRIYVGQELRLSDGGEASAPRASALVEPPKSKVEPLRSVSESAPVSRNSGALTAPRTDVPAPPAPAADMTNAKVDTPPLGIDLAPPPKPEPTNRPMTASVGVNAGIDWHWPSSGALIGGFVAGDQTRQGVDLAGHAGDPVNAAADGAVVYSGNGLLGYGELIIIKHNANFLSAYGHNRRRLVQEGDAVKAGQPVAEMGASGASREMLHFEIRKNGKPVNPLDYLPTR